MKGMGRKLVLALIPLILSIGIISILQIENFLPDVAALQSNAPPRKQMASGVASEDVVCKPGLTLIIKSSNGNPACVRPSTAAKLSSAGWGAIVKEFQVEAITDSRPNILVVVLDDTGFADYAFTGSEIPTPNLDSLRNDGKLFTNYHVLPTCSPTRSVLMTGVDNHLIGFGTMREFLADNQKGKPGYEGYLNDNVVTIPQLLKDNGYHTYMTGKWHLAYGGFDPTQDWEKWTRYDPYARGYE